MTAIALCQDKRKILCKCECGVEKELWVYNFKKGVKSCTCKRSALLSAARTSHGMTKTPTYETWTAMVIRCTSPGSVNYPRYGGAGITVCDRWRNSFENFLADMGERPSALYSLDRINNDGNYEPGNCRWATSKQQGNNRHSNRLITYLGQTKTLAEWCVELGVKRSAVFNRLQKGMRPEEAFTKPVVQINKKHSFAGSEKTVTEIAAETGLNYRTLAQLINTYGITPDDAVARLVAHKNRRQEKA